MTEGCLRFYLRHYNVHIVRIPLVVVHLYVVVAVLGEEQELDLSPLRNRLALGPPARGLSGV